MKKLISVFIMGLITLETSPVLLADLAIHTYESSEKQAVLNDFAKQRIVKHLFYRYFDFTCLKFLSLEHCHM